MYVIIHIICTYSVSMRNRRLNRYGGPPPHGLGRTTVMMVHLVLCVIVVLLFVQFVAVDSTTVVAAQCKDGIIVCADSLSAPSGPLVATRRSKKVNLLTDATILCCVNSAGLGATHFQQLYSELRDTIHEHSHRFENQLTTSSIAKITRGLIAAKYNEAHVVIAGYDKLNTVDSCSPGESNVKYVLSEVLPGGARIDQNIVAAGTGSALISSLLEESLRTSIPRNVMEGSTVADSDRERVSLTADVTTLSVQDTAAVLRSCIRQASRLDPQTGGDRYSLWVLSPPEAQLAQ